MRLGVDIYSLRFNDWNAFEFLEYAKSIGLGVVHFSEMKPFESLDSDYLAQVKRRADELSIDIEVGMGSICPTSVTFSSEEGTVVKQLTTMLHVAAELGSPALRCYLGSNADRRTEIPLDAHCVAAVASLREVRRLALDLDVKIAVENHAGDLQGRELARLIEEAGPDFVGACIDSGNPLWVAESPFVTLRHLAPYVVMSHVRDSAIWEHPRGAAVQWVAMGEGNVNIETWSNKYRELCSHTNFTLEIITCIPPRVIDYLDDDFWTVYPQTRAAEFAEYLHLVKNGYPFTEPVLTVGGGALPVEFRTALAMQQRTKLEQSVRYCRDVLHIG